jgi:hypothetical protein
VFRSSFSMKRWGIGILLVLLLFNANQVLAFQDDEDPVLTREQRFELAFDASIWPDYYYNRVLALAMCESSLRAGAMGDFTAQMEPESLGYLQVNRRYWPKLHSNFSLYDPVQNLNAGYVVFLAHHRTFDAWSCAK